MVSVAVLSLLIFFSGVSAWTRSSLPLRGGLLHHTNQIDGSSQAVHAMIPVATRQTMMLYSSSTDDFSATSAISDEEFEVISSLYQKAQGAETSLQEVVLNALPTMNPQLIMKLRRGVDDRREEFQAISGALSAILDAQLAEARDVLADFLNAGEVRKLDAMIGKAGREGKLDVAFFQVLNMNLEDAASDEQPIAKSDEPSATRYQILQHIYTRCQEEIEKSIPPGVSLLNKLLRTEAASIRANQLQHYLCPQPNIIKTPDGKELQLGGRERILVSHEEFVDAIGNAVKQIRTVENAGGSNREMAANMVEACRQVAKEARFVIGENFGRDSDTLRNFEESLQPIFRPESPSSPYMTGA